MGQVVDAFVQNQIDLAEFWIALVEPPGGPGRGPTDPVMRQALRDWRRARPLDVFERARRRFTDAGIEIYSCMYNFADDLSDDELEFPFEVAKTLGTNIISANCTKASIQRAARPADRHKTFVAAHAENAPFDRNPDGMVYEKNLVGGTVPLAVHQGHARHRSLYGVRRRRGGVRPPASRPRGQPAPQGPFTPR